VAAATPTPTRSRAGRAIRARHNWVQLAKFSTVGASGYVVNLAVFATLLDWAGLQYRLAAVVQALAPSLLARAAASGKVPQNRA